MVDALNTFSDHRGILITGAMLVATCDDRAATIPGGNVVIDGSEITFVGKNLPPALRRDNYRVIDAAGCVVIPGFINTHHHLFQTLTRALPQVQDAKLFDWLTFLYGIWRHVTPEAVHIGAKIGLAELLLTGCTTSVDQMYLFPQGQPLTLVDQTISAARELGIRFHPCHGSMSLGRSHGGLPPDTVVQPEDRILQESERLINTYHDPARLSMCRMVLAPCAPFNVSRELMRETAAFGRKKNVRLHTHLAETLDEEEFCRQKYGRRPFAYMEDLGWTGEDVWYAHAIHVNEGEIARIAETRTGVAHCPTSNLRLGSGIAPVRAMLDAGVRVSLAVDGAASNDSSDMLGELRQCLLVHRVASGAASMPAADVFRMATRGGADVLGRDDIGSLEAGKAADLAIFDMNRIGYAGALSDPLAALLFCGDSHIARTVIVNGNVVVDGGKIVQVNEDRLIEQANSIALQLISGGANHG
jgi:cytosine/adenosine deaminase-related metal-dependent hydrolase